MSCSRPVRDDDAALPAANSAAANHVDGVAAAWNHGEADFVGDWPALLKDSADLSSGERRADHNSDTKAMLVNVAN